jgi:hypothetical protein
MKGGSSAGNEKFRDRHAEIELGKPKGQQKQ